MATFQLTFVAFVHGVGGQLRVLATVDRGDVPLFDGDPALLVEHRPGRGASALVVELADAAPDGADAVVLERAGAAIVEVVEACFQRDGSFAKERLLGAVVAFSAADDLFG